MSRIPFALVGCLLLVSSATFVGSLHRPAVENPAVDEAIDRTAAATQTALREAAMTAARKAALNPVTVPAETPAGKVLGTNETFRDSLRLRIYLAARDRLSRLSGRRGPVHVRASLPGTPTPESLATALRGVTVSRAGPNGTELATTVHNVTITATRDGRVVGRRTVSPTLVVPTPTLAVHDRVREFERRLDAGPLDPGLGRRLTASLYPVVWARGYAQYGGTPIENVLANRHVGLVTNAAILSMQAETFGQSDPAGRQVLADAVAGTALTDIDSGSGIAAREHLRYAGGATGPSADATGWLADLQRRQPATGQSVSIGVNATADRAFLETNQRLDDLLRRAYAADVDLRIRVEKRSERRLDGQRPVDSDWRHRSTDRSVETTVSDGAPDLPPPPGDGHLLTAHRREVTRTIRTDRTYLTGNGTVTRTARSVERFAVGVFLRGDHHRVAVPERPVRTIHERGGPFDGPNMADIAPRATERLLEDRGGVDALARRAVGGSLPTGNLTVVGDRPAGLRQWVSDDLASFHARVRNVSVTATRGAIATFDATPAADLAATLRERRHSLLNVPRRYDSVAHRARVAVRADYLDRVIARLEERARRARERREKLGSALADRTTVGNSSAQEPGHGQQPSPLEGLREGYDRRDRLAGPNGSSLSMTVDAAPAYLTRGSVGSEVVPAVPGPPEHPLVVRNWNALAVPYGDAADAVAGAVFGPGTVRLGTAAQVLRAAGGNGWGGERTRLRRQVREANGHVADAAVRTLRESKLGERGSRRAVVTEGLAAWNSPATKALAFTNGSAARSIQAAALERWPDSIDPVAAEELAVRLRLTIRTATADPQARPAQPAVNGTVQALREGVEAELSGRLGDLSGRASRRAIERVVGTTLARLPAGLPVAPLPGLWYATVNLWHVQVRGEYARFAISVPRGTPDRPGGRFQYVRDGSRARLDVDGDGTPETLGRAGRVSFATSTVVGVAVPPGPGGVGDVDGQADERSPGWPTPGPVEE